ncbi:cadherin-like beta sandwich domain-containing protein [Chelativorans sp. YIM 93263]|uniref:cadherin-like beta sandwich domain-containing protein n=1 Tax=Chelativorans sp. YIM 93263 TaxID=2906648 RepID=UPI0023786F32|nr:cadherin-like beta sandwich domain-containing protein [Chelativorans sp. YIM 93263]
MALVPSAGTLDPAFAAGTLGYTIAVANSIDTITLTPAADDANATITVDGRLVISGSESQAISLSMGSTAIPVTVTAQDGVTTQTYTVIVTRAEPDEIVARDFTVEVPYGASLVSVSFADHVDGSNQGFGVEFSDISAMQNFEGGIRESPNPNFRWTFRGEGFVQGGTVRYFTCAEYSTWCARRGPGAVMTLVVTGAPAAPIVSSVTGPAKGTYKAGDDLTFTVVFDQPVTVTGTPGLSLDIGGAAQTAALVAGSGTDTLSFRYTVQSGDFAPSGIDLGPAISLNGGTIESSGGTAANLTLNNVPDLSGMHVDAVAPMVLSSTVGGTPAPNATTVYFVVTFSEPVTGDDGADFELTTTGSATGSISDISTADNITYDVTINGVSGVGTLRVDVLNNGSIADAVSNPPAVGFTSGALWTRGGSADADLSSLVPSAGTLDPAFDSDTSSYSIAVDNEVETISFTPAASDPNATIIVNGQTVNSGSASPAIPLAIGANTITVAVTAADGGTRQTYTVVVTRAASSNAELVGLVSSAGTLDPAFDANTFSYTIAVGKEVEMLTLTPTAAEPNAAITVNAQTVASGTASPAVVLPAGSTSIPVVVTAQDGTTTLTYSISVERAPSVPTVASRTVEIYAGETASVELTEGATGGPFTDVAIVDVSDEDAGVSRIEEDGQSYRLIFESSPTYAGTSSVRYTLSNAAGPSAPGIITFNVLARPDPSQDLEVIGLLTAQVVAAKRFAEVQTRNFNDRLEQLHDEGDRRSNSMNVRLSFAQEQDPSNLEIQELIDNSRHAAAGDLDERAPGLLGYGPHGLGGSGALAAAEDLSSVPSSDVGGIDLGDYAVWSGGFVNFGERDGTIDLEYTNVGISGGIDYRFTSQFIGGFGVGYSRDKTDVGENGTETSANAYSAAIYGSYKPFENFFLDGLIGGSWLDFDSTRYITTSRDFATGSRSGHQLFGSVTAAYEIRDETWLVSPYGRVELSRSWLNGFTEDDGGMFALRYSDQHVDTLSGVLGMRTDYTFVLDWGTLTPGVRVEYTHDFAGSSRVGLGYADLDGLPYVFEFEPTGQSYTTLRLSFDAELPQDWSAVLDYRTSFGSDQQDHAFGLEISKRF